MPELPDVEAYLAALRSRIVGARLERIRLANPFILRSVDPPPAEVSGRAVTGLRRLGEKFPTGALATLRLETSWRELGPGGGYLESLVVPRDLAR